MSHFHPSDAPNGHRKHGGVNKFPASLREGTFLRCDWMRRTLLLEIVDRWHVCPRRLILSGHVVKTCLITHGYKALGKEKKKTPLEGPLCHINTFMLHHDTHQVFCCFVRKLKLNQQFFFYDRQTT